MAFLSFFGTGFAQGSKRASAPFLPLAAGGVLQKDRKALSSHSSAKCNQASSSAFTIVELLIVVVVIAILAAVTIVAYNGITNRAKGSAVASSVTQAGKKLEVFKTTTGAGFYPADITAANTAIGSSLTLTKYLTNTPTNPTNYCATITDTSTSPATSYSVSSTSSTTMAGECVENLFFNPSFETNTNSWGANWGTTGAGSLTRPTTGGVSGTGFARMTWSVAATVQWGGFEKHGNSVIAGQPYSFSAYVRTSQTEPLRLFLRWPSFPTVGDVPGLTVSLSSNSWTRLTAVVNSSPAGEVSMATLIGRNGAGNWQVGDILDVDAAMLVQTVSTYSYGDGDSPGWFWTGAPNNSTSIGPATVL